MIYGLNVAKNLEIVLEGTNKLISATEDAPTYMNGIEIHFNEDYVTHNLSISATEGGSLEIDATYKGIYSLEGKVIINSGALVLNKYIGSSDSSVAPERSTVVVNGGDITINTDKNAISASTLDFNNGKLEINGTGNGYTMISSPTISVNDGEILVKSEKSFPASGTITMAAGISAAASTNVDGTDPVEYDKAKYYTYHYLKIAKGAMPEKTDYDVWVNGERFTNTKTTINLADGETASYDYTTNTVTFSDGAAVTEGYCPDTTQSYNPYYGIYSTEGKNLNIVMEGDLSFNLNDNSNTSKIFGGIYVPDSKTISITGSAGESAFTSTYSIPEVTDGTYTLRVSKANHVTRDYTVTVNAADFTQDVELILLGDVHKDGIINAKDILKLRKHFANPSANPLS